MLRWSIVVGSALTILAVWSPAWAQSRLVNFGPLAFIQLPPEWLRSEQKLAGRWDFVSFDAPGQSKTSIGFIFGPPHNGGTAAYSALRQLLAENAKANAPVSLTPQQIRTISPALGNIGDNQFANDAVKYAGPRAPAFNVASAQLVELNGKSALKIDGTFRDKSGKPVTWLVGFAVTAVPPDEGLLEAFLQSSSQPGFESQRKSFDAALRTVAWRN